MPINGTLRLLLSTGLLIISTHRLPAPISEIPETPSPSPTATPSSAETRANHNAPEKAMIAYFDCLNRRDVLAAYELFSSRFRSHNSFQQYQKTFASTLNVNLLRVEQISMTATESTVFVEFDELRPHNDTAHWRGTIDLVLEGANWRVDSMRGLKTGQR